MLDGLTDAQREAVTATGDVLVSAAAGSGKTRVLSTRCAWLVSDAPDAVRCDVPGLVVVTFTVKAAGEMRGRIEAALRARAGASPDDERLQRQVLLLPRASVGTIHGFCSTLLRRHFHRLGLDPRFRVLDPDESKLLRLEVTRDVFERLYADDGEIGGRFAALIDAHGEGNDAAVGRTVRRLDELLASLPDPEAWLADQLHEAATGERAATAEAAWLEGELRGQSDRWQRLAGEAANLPLHPKHAAAIAELADAATHLAEVADGGDRETREAALADVLKRLPTPRADDQQKAAWAGVKARIDTLRKPLRDGPLPAALLADPARAAADRENVRPHVETLVEVWRRYDEAHAAAKQAQAALDFADLERLTLRLLADHADARRDTQRRHRHVLVDEYQDTNPLQEAILQQLTGGGRTSLFCVGDVKQSIYRFRLAGPDNFLARRGMAGVTLVDLAANFRSTRAVIDPVNATFADLMTGGEAEIDYAAGHALDPGKPQQDAGAGRPATLDVVLKDAEDASEDAADEAEEREADHVAAMLVAKKRREPEYDLGGVLVLLRSYARSGEVWARRLRRAGIPVAAQGGGGFFAAREVRDVLALLEVLDNARRDVAVAALLRSPVAGVDEPEELMARLRLAEPKATFAEAFRRSAEPAAVALRGKLERWRHRLGGGPLAAGLWSVLREAGYLTHARCRDDGPQREANVMALIERARAFDGFGRHGLHRFVAALRALEAETDVEVGDPALAGGGAVRLMTVHAAKGLEADTVIVAQLGRRFNDDDLRGPAVLDRDAGIGLRAVDVGRMIRWDTAGRRAAAAAVRRRSRAEALRVLYVAMTRARRRLVLVGTLDRRARGALDKATPGLDADTPLHWLVPLAREGTGLRLRDHEPPAAPEPLTLEPAAADEADAAALADAALARASWRYRHQALADTPALATASKLGHTTSDLLATRSNHAPADAAAFGTAMHLLLQHADFRRPETLAATARRLREEGRFGGVEVDVDAAAWVLAGEVGDAARARPGDVLREVPIEYARPAPGGDGPADRQIVRGVIDLVLPVDGGWWVVDYKTDRDPAGAADRHGPQVALYAEALAAATGRPVVRRTLAMLAARELIDL